MFMIMRMFMIMLMCMSFSWSGTNAEPGDGEDPSSVRLYYTWDAGLDLSRGECVSVCEGEGGFASDLHGRGGEWSSHSFMHRRKYLRIHLCTREKRT